MQCRGSPTPVVRVRCIFADPQRHIGKAFDFSAGCAAACGTGVARHVGRPYVHVDVTQHLQVLRSTDNLTIGNTRGESSPVE
jgi:hypothetical protein